MAANRTPIGDEEGRLIFSLHRQGLGCRAIAIELARRGFCRSKNTINRYIRGTRGGIVVIEDLDEAASSIPKILYFDIETTNFSAGFGEILCMGYKWHDDDEVRVIKIQDFDGWDDLTVERRDLYICKFISALICDADVLVGHYSKKFDHAFIQTRLLIHGLPPIPDTPHIDTWRIARFQLKFSNNKMKTIAKSLRISNRKDKVELDVWRRANAHDTASIDEIAEYCKQDVRVQFEMTQKLLPVARNMPCWNLFTDDERLACPACGGFDIRPRGTVQTKVNTYPRFQCARCGKWMRGRRTLTPREHERMMP